MYPKVVLSFLFCLFGTEICGQCSYQQMMVPGTTYVVQSPGYSYYYASGLSCYWQTITDVGYSIVLTCPDTQIACGDTLSVNVYGQPYGTGDVQIPCTTRNALISSATNAMRINLSTRTNQGRFYCTVAAQVDYCQCGRRQVSKIM